MGIKKYTPFSFIFKCKAKSCLISLVELKWTRRQSTRSKNPSSIIPLNHCFVAEKKVAFQHMKILLYSLALWFWVVDQRRMFNLLRKINLFLFCIPQVFQSIFSCVINNRSRHLSDSSQCLHWVQSKTSQPSCFAFYTKYVDKAKAEGLHISSSLGIIPHWNHAQAQRNPTGKIQFWIILSRSSSSIACISDPVRDSACWIRSTSTYWKWPS